MYKILFIINTLILSFNLNAINYEKYFYVIKQPNIIESNEIIEFFSFYCRHCLNFYKNYEKIIKINIPKNHKFIEYHVSFLGGNMGKMLTKAWSVAMILGITEKIKPAIFENIHLLNNLQDIKNIFYNIAGISEENYDIAWNSIIVKSLFNKQEKKFFNMKVNSIPIILIKDKYILNFELIDNSSTKSFIYQYKKILDYIINKNKLVV